MSVYPDAYEAMASSCEQHGASTSCVATEQNRATLRRVCADWYSTDGDTCERYQGIRGGRRWSVCCRLTAPRDGESAVLCPEYPTPEAVELRRREVSASLARDVRVDTYFFHPVPGGWRVRVTHRAAA